MYFDLTDEQKLLRDTLTSLFARHSPHQQLLAADRPAVIDRDRWAEVCATGVLGAMVPEAQGGAGMDLLTLAVIAEACGANVLPLPVVQNALAAWLLSTDAVAETGGEWVERLIGGDAIAAFVVPLAGNQNPTDGEPRSALVERGSEADVFVIVDNGLWIASAGNAGVSISEVDGLDLTRPLARVGFEPGAATLLSTDPTLAGRLFDALLISYAADALGAAAALQRSAVEYAKERRQYGRLIGSFQALKHQLADVSVDLEPARPLCWYAAHSWDTARDDHRRMAAIAKAHLGEVTVSSARACIEAFGGIGYTWEHPAHLYLKRAMFDRSALGTPALHRERAAVIAGWGGIGAA
ncbi:acyl-CoA dehydrogenase family protein [Rhizorhabdus sp.]|uniref:acyl-CoA dehydrogenase family protein n=1 Tax=Rhizorhabdus sp. TaxID=1968843 RepID=UPI00199B0AED|nr:acyl-CoA dehydrogenase family protein [Rhizorhabdus sp.]MBD3759617.1 acyl-CoA/acyl-ACP dehydrogenase [Rhizorhabdus sp.]